MPKTLLDIYTGIKRPRHKRFSLLAKEASLNLGMNYLCEKPTMIGRLGTKIKTQISGYRYYSKKIDPSYLALVHHAIPNRASNFLLEIDLPMGLSNYRVRNHRKSWQIIKSKLEATECKGILVFSEWAKRNFILHFGPMVGQKTFVLYPTSYTGLSDVKFSQKKLDFVFISTQFLMKGGYQVIEAFKNLQISGYNDARLLVVTNLNEVKDIVDKNKTNNNIKWLDANLSEQQISNLLKDSKCLIHPSLSDSFGVVVLEAMSHGCAVISTNMASFPELVSNENGFLITPPISTTTFNAYITEYGDANYYNDYLRTLNLEEFSEKIFQFMKLFLSNEKEAFSLMHGSIKKFDKSFSRNIWIENFQKIIAGTEFGNF